MPASFGLRRQSAGVDGAFTSFRKTPLTLALILLLVLVLVLLLDPGFHAPPRAASLLPHSKTLRDGRGATDIRPILECACFSIKQEATAGAHLTHASALPSSQSSLTALSPPLDRSDHSAQRADMLKAAQYDEILDRLGAVLEGETDEIAAMATIVCELHHGLEYFNWTGFYRVVSPGLLKIGPYQGGHGCLTIPFERGVCGRCAREAKTQIVPDVTQVPEHIACSSSTRSEIVVPMFDTAGHVRAVLDVDSDAVAAFDDVDARHLEEICRLLTRVWSHR